MSATVKYAFRESRAGTGAPKRLQAGPAHVPEKVPRIARLLALAHKFQRMLDSGEVESMAELARLGRVSRARITQIMDLLMLAPDIQEAVLVGDVGVAIKRLIVVPGRVRWDEQRAVVAPMLRSLGRPQIDCKAGQVCVG